MKEFSKEEQEILLAFEANEWRSIRDSEKEAERFQAYAQATQRKDRRVNIRLARRDLEALQKRAIIEGIPYQTLMASVLHKYVEGRLVESD